MEQGIGKKFKKAVILDSVIFYPEHRLLLNSLVEEVLEYPSSLPENLEKQYNEEPELFKNLKCYTQLGVEDTPMQLLMNRIEGADVVISCWTAIPDEILRLNPQLKLIVFWTHEKEHRVNLKLAKELGITVNNIPDYGTDAVTEVVFAGLWELLLRNHQSTKSPKSENELTHAVMGELFSRYRKLKANEKYTRVGKFTHHFHKLGLVDWSFEQKTLDQLIPERLIEDKHIGLLNIEKSEKLANTLQSFNCKVEVRKITDSNLAEFYKFLSGNEIIFFDKSRTNQEDLKKISSIAWDKLVDINELATANYSFKEKIFGVIGAGRIGIKVAKIAKNLGFEVIYYSKTRKLSMEKQLGLKYKELPGLLKTSDIISVHVPAHKAENLLNKKLINSIKVRTIFINTADGNTVDQQALTKRMLKNEVLAYLDVYPGLPRKDILGIEMKEKTDWKLRKILPNHVLAYRAGWKTQESIRVKTYKLLGELVDYLIGKKDAYSSSKEF